MNKIRKGDEVIVLVGKDKGKRGVVQQCIEDRVVVAGVNVAKKTTKPNPMTGATGGIVDKLMPIHVSNVALFNAKTGKADRVGFKEVDGKKFQVTLYKAIKSDGITFSFPSVDSEDITSLPVTMQGKLDTSRAQGDQLLEIIDEIGVA